MTGEFPNLKSLTDEISSLDKFLLEPIKTEAPDPMKVDEIIGIRSYLLLSHAAIEEFIEYAFLSYIGACSSIDENGRAHVGSYLAILQLADYINGQNSKNTKSPDKILGSVPGLYESKFIRPNNGIKEKDIQKLALGAGLPWSEIENACASLIPACETLGSKRGAIAHSSINGTLNSRSGIVSNLYPKDARSFTNSVLSNMSPLLAHLSETSSTAPRNTRPSIRSNKSYLYTARRYMRGVRKIRIVWPR